MIPVLFRTDQILDESGRLIGRVAVLSDMSERRLAEQALRRSQETLSTMIKTATPSMTPPIDATVKKAMRRPVGNSCFSAR